MKRSLRADAASRRLRAAGNAEELDRILQDECRRRAAKKLAATLLNPGFRFPTELSAEQCTGDDIAELHALMVSPGDSVVDLTCGLGIDAFHIARRAKHVLAIDMDPEVAASIEPNARVLGVDNVTALNADCLEWLRTTDQQFDVAFIDPARRDDSNRRLFSLADCRPDVVAALPLIERVAPRLIIKMSPMLDISRVLTELPCTERLHVIGTASECKELVSEVNFGHRTEPQVIVHTIGHPTLSFRPADCRAADRFANEIRPGQIIGEPWPTIMKAAPRGLLPGTQLHASTNLWIDVPENFPGKRYEVTDVVKFSSSALRRLSRSGIKASVATRNFPLTAAELRSKLKAEENSALRLMATTIAPDCRLLLFLRPITLPQ